MDGRDVVAGGMEMVVGVNNEEVEKRPRKYEFIKEEEEDDSFSSPFCVGSSLFSDSSIH